MNKRTAFDIDCSRLVPECGFACPKCIEEIEAMLTGVAGNLDLLLMIYY